MYLTKELIVKSKFEQVCCLNDSEKLVIYLELSVEIDE